MRVWCFKGCVPEAPGCSWQHTSAFQHETRFYHFAQNTPIPNGHKCLKLITEDNNEENKETQNSFWSSLNWENRTSKNETCSISYKLTVSFPKGLYRNNHIIYLPPNPTSWKLFVQCKLVTSMKDKSGHKIIIWKSTDAPVAHNLWTVGWQVLHYAAAEKVQHTLVWKQKKRVICMVMEHVCGRADQLLRAKLFDFIQMKNLLDFGKFTNAS